MKTTQVIHWETKELIEIINNETYELSIPQKYFEKWQNSINVIESLVNVSSVLLRTLEENNLIVRACSNNKNNPFSLNDKKALLTGSCCETLIANNSSLYIEDNQKNLKWKDNLDFISNLKSYLGLPLYWPNKEIFGTICLYNDNNIPFENFLILEEFQESIQKDLSIIFLKNENKNLTHELDMAIRSKKYFLSALTNDLRKPLFGLMGLIDLNVQKDFQDIELNNDFKLLKDSAEYLKTVIDNTLDFGYIRHEDFRLNQNLITTDKLFKQVIDINNFTF